MFGLEGVDDFGDLEGFGLGEVRVCFPLKLDGGFVDGQVCCAEGGEGWFVHVCCVPFCGAGNGWGGWLVGFGVLGALRVAVAFLVGWCGYGCEVAPHVCESNACLLGYDAVSQCFELLGAGKTDFRACNPPIR